VNTIGAHRAERSKERRSDFGPIFPLSLVVHSASMGIEDCVTNVCRRVGNKHIKLRLLRTRAYICGFVELCNLRYLSLTIHSSENSFSDRTRISEDTELVHVVFLFNTFLSLACLGILTNSIYLIQPIHQEDEEILHPSTLGA